MIYILISEGVSKGFKVHIYFKQASPIAERWSSWRSINYSGITQFISIRCQPLFTDSYTIHCYTMLCLSYAIDT